MAGKITSVRVPRPKVASSDGRIDEASLVGLHVGDRYRLRELIGQGGMGGVFRAVELATGRLVALKLLHPELAHLEYVARRFEREAQVASRLAHPNIVEILDFGESNGHLYIAMELLAGESLADAIWRGDLHPGRSNVIGRALRLVGAPAPPLGVAAAMAVMRQILAALAHAHGRGVVHRDLKPENIMLLPAGSGAAVPRVKLLDFGIAKLADEAPRGAKPLTQAGIPLGTPEYMSPEQAAGEASDERADLYSCGVILFEMLTGRLPFEASSAVQLLSMQLTAPPPSPRQVAPAARIPEAVERVVLRALAKRREERFASAEELLGALEAAVGAPSGAAATARSAPVPAGHPRWRRVAAVGVGAFVAALVVADHHAPARPPLHASARVEARAAHELERACAAAPPSSDTPKRRKSRAR